jgi:thiol-disulfide isomerase/thioredoxin
MKKLKIKLSWVVVGILILYLSSTFAFAGLQSARRSGSSQGNIVYYKLNNATMTTLIQQGATIVKFDYNDNCEGCAEQKVYLEQIAKEFEKQLILEEITNTNVTLPEVMITSIYGNTTLIKPTEDKIFATLCNLLTNPPITCVTTNVTK